MNWDILFEHGVIRTYKAVQSRAKDQSIVGLQAIDHKLTGPNQLEADQRPALRWTPKVFGVDNHTIVSAQRQERFITGS